MSDFDAEELLHKLTSQFMAANPGFTAEEAEKMAKSLVNKSLSGGLSSFFAVDSEPVDFCETAEKTKSDETKAEVSAETTEKLDKILKIVNKAVPPQESLRLKLSRGKAAVFDSKMGGVPYLPKSMEYPAVGEGEYAGKPLHFIAQLNFEHLPHIAGFPTSGILQFFAGCDGDYTYGLESDYRVIYHEKIINDAAGLYDKSGMPDFDPNDDYLPFTGEFLLTARETTEMPVNEVDFRFWNTFLAAYNELFGTKIDKIYGEGGLSEVDKSLYDAVFDKCNSGGTRMGGYPFFTQYDPRENNSEFTVLLFQSDSENGGDSENWDDSVCWGDMGVANFFITPEDLEKRDFSNVLFYWDCC